MPFAVRTVRNAGTGYGSPFVDGPRDVEQITVDMSTLTYSSGAGEVDADGYIKPGVILNRAGDRITAAEGGQTTASVAGGAAGDHTVTGITTDDEILEVISENTTSGVSTNLTSEFSITGTNTINNAGGTSTAGAVLFVRYLDASAEQEACVVIEAVKVPGLSNVSDDTAVQAASDFQLAVARGGLLNLDMIEDNLGRALTGAEKAAVSQSNLLLTAT